MSISSKLSDITTAISSAYTAVSNKGGTVPGNACLNNLPTAIGTIPFTTVTPLSVSANGTYTASSGYAYSPVEVNVQGGDSKWEQVVMRTVTTFEDSTMSYAAENAFAYCLVLSEINLPECLTISSFAFDSCSGLTTISLPKCKYIKYYAFHNCTNLSSVSLPECIEIGDVSNGNGTVFASCTNLTTISLPKCTTIENRCFLSCRNLTTISLPKCTKISTYAFSACTNLTTISLPKCTEIGQSVFQGCTKLSEIFIGTSNCSLANSSVFRNTKITTTAGSIYVPTAYVTTYKGSTNWATFANRIFGYTP